MIIVLSVFNGGQTHSVGCPHISLEAIEEIRGFLCALAVFQVVGCKSVNQCPPDGGVVSSAVVANVLFSSMRHIIRTEHRDEST